MDVFEQFTLSVLLLGARILQERHHVSCHNSRLQHIFHSQTKLGREERVLPPIIYALL